MRRFVIFLLFMLCFLSIEAQQISLVVDNQNPGWLSNKIGYGDQKSVQNLKVTGYINADDLTFIGEMISKQSLRGTINLEGVNIVGKTTSEDNVMPKNAFNIQWSADYPEGLQISEIIFPLSLTKSTNCLSSLLFVDKITIGGEAMPSVKGEDLYDIVYSGGDGVQFNKRVKHLTLREGVTEIPERAFYNKPYRGYGTPKEECRFESVSIPTTVKKVGKMAFHYCYSLKDFILPDSIEIIESDAFTKTSFVPDTLDLPLNLKTFYTNSFTHKANQVIIIKENVEIFDNYNWYITKSTNLTFVIHCITPPVFRKGTEDDWYSPSYSDGKELSGCTIYVPKESFSLYSDPTYDSVGGDHWSGWANPYSYAELQTINVPATSIEIDFESVELVKGTVKQLSAIVLPTDADSTEYSWSSSDSNIVSVSSTGLITANSSGEAYVIATLNADSTIVDSCKVKVHQPVTSIALNTKEKAMNVGETYTLTVTINPNDADNKNILWTSENPEIASIENGTIKALSAGVVKISATSEDNNNATDYCEVIVTQPTTGISLNYSEYTFEKIGATIQLEAMVLPEDATNKNVNWKSSNENVCIVSNGMVVALSPGTSIIIATTVDGGYMATCTISVEIDTSINYINESNSNSNFKVYSIDGRMRQSLQRGINIIVFENGQRMKVYVKE